MVNYTVQTMPYADNATSNIYHKVIDDKNRVLMKDKRVFRR